MCEKIIPTLISCKSLKEEFSHLQTIPISAYEFSLGRGIQNEAIIPFLSISRNHCFFKKIKDSEEWIIEDKSTFGIDVNGVKVGKGQNCKLSHGDVIDLEPSGEFRYKFVHPTDNDFEIPRKRMKIDKSQDTPDGNIAHDVKTKFEASQKCEIDLIEDKIQNAKQMQTTSLILKQQLEDDMNRKLQQMKKKYASQIESLKGEKSVVEKQKAILIEQRDSNLLVVRKEMETKISKLMEQIQKHNETEAELTRENNLLREKLLKEREEFLSELNRESSSKHDMLEKLEAKIKEQEEIRLKEKMELEQMLRNETEQLRIAKEQELQKLEEQKLKREKELEQELMSIKQNLEQQKLQAELDLNKQKEEMKKLSEGENLKVTQLIKEREEIQLKLQEAKNTTEKLIAEQQIRCQMHEREIQLQQTVATAQQILGENRSFAVIKNVTHDVIEFQAHLSQIEPGKDGILELICGLQPPKEGVTLNEVGEVMESELQCSICAELFVKSTTLNCSHTFCLYCISTWKKKKKDCPICRTPITTECRSLVLDSFIERMVQKLPNEMKLKREDILKTRQELECQSANANARATRNRSHGSDAESATSDSENFEEGEEEHDESDYYESIWEEYSDADDRLDDELDGFEDASASDSGSGSNIASDSDNGARNISNGFLPGRPGAYYGGYGRCYNCGCRGHWLPGCPFREPTSSA